MPSAFKGSIAARPRSDSEAADVGVEARLRGIDVVRRAYYLGHLAKNQHGSSHSRDRFGQANFGQAKMMGSPIHVWGAALACRALVLR